MIYYCKKCGYVGIKIEKEAKCPICHNKTNKISQNPDYYSVRTDKTAPTYEDVVRRKFLKDVVFDEHYSSIRKMREDNKYRKINRDRERLLKAMKQSNSSSFNNINSSPIVECPYCHSTNTRKISGLGRAASIGFWGIFSKKIGKQWHCDNCRSDF